MEFSLTMTQNQLTIPTLACPNCLRKVPLHEIDGEPRISRHIKTCNEAPQAEGLVEAAELAGIESSEWETNWREYISHG